MTNKDVAKTFQLLGKLLELHGENPFKTRSYSSAYVTIRKLGYPVLGKSKEELQEVPGIGKAISEKIVELNDTGELVLLNKYLDQTPKGIVQLLQVKGFGPKKVKAVWKEMGIESPGELLYACQENRLVELKGFGAKSQETLKAQLIYFLDSQGKYLYGHIIEESTELLLKLRKEFNNAKFDFINGLRRKMPIVNGIEILTTEDLSSIEPFISNLSESEQMGDYFHYKGSKVILNGTTVAEYDDNLFRGSGSEDFVDTWINKYGLPIMSDNRESFKANGLAYIPPETRELPEIIEQAQKTGRLGLIDYSDIKGVVHTHSTFSDGTNTVEEMALASIDEGYEYLVMSDHSKAAFYANGLTEDRVIHQMKLIDELNENYQEFHIYKSIECDILYNGDLDYDDEFLTHFDLVIASVHSNLKMDKAKATERILKAVSHPATSILGHPTGRLLLSREGYPLDHIAIIDQCAEYNVAIEINASPYRLDLDWEWIYYAREKGVLLSINPDAHSIAGIGDIRYGIDAARKGGLLLSECLNAKNKVDFDSWINEQKSC